MEKTILIKPVISEKSEGLTEKIGKYTFVVDKKANKIEIKKAVEGQYNVSVESVNTMIMPAKNKVRNTRSGMVKGRVAAYKKAIVTLATGEEIDFFGDI
jgi:large subunit ribosomal protein L23